MRTFKLNNTTRSIGDNKIPDIVAEINTSHFGNMDIAKDMIIKAKEIGCDCVKFQSWSADTLYSKTYYEENPIANRMFKKLAFNEDDLIEVADFSIKNEIDFSSTPYSKAEVEFLVYNCNVHFVNNASMELNNYPNLNS